MIKRYDFNNTPSDRPNKPLVNLAYANGIPPETYRLALQPLFEDYQVVSIHARPLWDDCPPESLTAWAQLGDDLLAGLNELTDKPVIGIGHSVGGAATMYAAVKQPHRFRALVLIEPTLLAPPTIWLGSVSQMLGRNPRKRLAEGALRRRRSWESVEEAYQYFKGKRLFQRSQDAVIRAYAESITMPSPAGGVQLRWSPEWEAKIFSTFDPTAWRLPRKLTMPTLVIRGTLSDTFTAVSALVFRLRNPRAKLVRVEGAGHLVPQDKPELVGKLISEFLATL